MLCHCSCRCHIVMEIGGPRKLCLLNRWRHKGHSFSCFNNLWAQAHKEESCGRVISLFVWAFSLFPWRCGTLFRFHKQPLLPFANELEMIAKQNGVIWQFRDLPDHFLYFAAHVEANLKVKLDLDRSHVYKAASSSKYSQAGRAIPLKVELPWSAIWNIWSTRQDLWNYRVWERCRLQVGCNIKRTCWRFGAFCKDGIVWKHLLAEQLCTQHCWTKGHTVANVRVHRQVGVVQWLRGFHACLFDKSLLIKFIMESLDG